MSKVLLASSDGETASILSAEIEAEGYEVEWVTDGLDAYEFVLSAAPSVLLLDRQLEIFSGLELCGRLREDPDAPKALPVYLLTDEPVDPHVLERAGATGVFPKTHPAGQLRDLLARHAGLD